jgi:hypothetical protein
MVVGGLECDAIVSRYISLLMGYINVTLFGKVMNQLDATLMKFIHVIHLLYNYSALSAWIQSRGSYSSST